MSNGLKCGTTTDCNTVFKYTPDGGAETSYYAACDGLSVFACANPAGMPDHTMCDSLAGFKCADWFSTTGTKAVGCAAETAKTAPVQCGQAAVVITGTSAGTYAVACTGLAGETCAGADNGKCDANFNSCTSQWNSTTLNWVPKSGNVCMASESCGKAVNASDPAMNNTVYLCFN